MATLAYERVGSTMLLAHATEPPSDAEWDAYVQALITGDNGGLIVWTDGAGPNAGQRKRLLAQMGTKQILTAVVTPSLLARGIVTALSWLNVPIRAFAPSEADEAIEFVGAGGDRARVLRVAAALRIGLVGGDTAKAAELPLAELARLAASPIARLRDAANRQASRSPRDDASVRGKS